MTKAKNTPPAAPKAPVTPPVPATAEGTTPPADDTKLGNNTPPAEGTDDAANTPPPVEGEGTENTSTPIEPEPPVIEDEQPPVEEESKPPLDPEPYYLDDAVTGTPPPIEGETTPELPKDPIPPGPEVSDPTPPADPETQNEKGEYRAPAPTPQIPTIGRIVIFVPVPGSLSASNNVKEVPAMVVNVFETGYGMPLVNLKVFTDGPGEEWIGSVIYDETDEPMQRTWHWPVIKR